MKLQHFKMVQMSLNIFTKSSTGAGPIRPMLELGWGLHLTGKASAWQA
jgi:hypothetical protein